MASFVRWAVPTQSPQVLKATKKENKGKPFFTEEEEEEEEDMTLDLDVEQTLLTFTLHQELRGHEQAPNVEVDSAAPR